MRKDGYITIYLSLTMAAMLIFIFTMVEAIRIQTIRFQAECVMDIGLTSIFAEYNREMLKQYNLLAIDTSYGYSDIGINQTKSNLLRYMNINFIAPGQSRIPNYKDLTAMHADNAELSKVSYLSDDSGEVMKYQIVQVMKEQTGIDLVDGITDAISAEDYESRFEHLEGEKNSFFAQIKEILANLNRDREEEDYISIDNPADYVEAMRRSALLDMAVKDSIDISRRYVNLSEYISHRDYQNGVGLWEGQDSSADVVDNTLFLQYLFEKCGYFREGKAEAELGYQLEYLLYGKNSDFENLENFAKQLFMLRYVINATYLFNCSAKVNEAATLAALVTTGIGSPQLTEAVKMTILFSWCYAETIQDLRILFDGNAVAEVKSDGTWNVALSEMLHFVSTLDTYHSVEGGKNYFDYLAAFICAKNNKELRMRLMDIMEMDIRRTTGNQYFQMDKCIYQLVSEVNLSSEYGYGYSISRDYSYE